MLFFSLLLFFLFFCQALQERKEGGTKQKCTCEYLCIQYVCSMKLTSSHENVKQKRQYNSSGTISVYNDHQPLRYVEASLPQTRRLKHHFSPLAPILQSPPPPCPLPLIQPHSRPEFCKYHFSTLSSSLLLNFLRGGTTILPHPSPSYSLVRFSSTLVGLHQLYIYIYTQNTIYIYRIFKQGVRWGGVQILFTSSQLDDDIA